MHAAAGGGTDDPMYGPFVHAISTLLDPGAADGTLKRTSTWMPYSCRAVPYGGSDPARGDAEVRAARILRLVVDGPRV
ncbi:hypothetical protein ABZ357_30995 [Streptomyces sp. NPDC005917]|uniref:hypothetical protein n=1 Tax=unclassified Streptomyces TaxID=2593676 RepID=UPI0034016FCD